jgi:BirA family transcriptional regulator, biotin operon repressor / biotin---[acetyl-CoA-carboxylase] ligase
VSIFFEKGSPLEGAGGVTTIPHLHYHTLTSTSDLAKHLGRLTGAHVFPEGLCITADVQTAGRGQFERKWVSPPGGVYFSFLSFLPMGFKGRQPLENPNVWLRSSAAQPDEIPYVIALKLQTWLAKNFQINTEVKLPNDLLVNGKKLCGILVEKVTRGEASFWIIGIGLNLNQQLFPDFLPDATSLSLLSGKTYDRYAIIESLIEECVLWFGE